MVFVMDISQKAKKDFIFKIIAMITPSQIYLNMSLLVSQLIVKTLLVVSQLIVKTLLVMGLITRTIPSIPAGWR